MKLKDLTGAIRPSEHITIIEIVRFSIVETVVFSGTLTEYFEKDFFKKLKNKNVLSVKATGEKQMEITIEGKMK